jgi:serpin B
MTEPTFEAPYGQSASWKAIELPYADSSLSMLVVMPSAGTLTSFERHLNPAALGRIAGTLRQSGVELRMPRLTLRLHTSLNSALEALGMPDAFGASADFSGITHATSLQIQDVEHAAYMRVDEAGTVAAAATGISVLPTAILAPTVRLTVNRPFLLFLRDDTTGAILFAGRVMNPAGS